MAAHWAVVAVSHHSLAWTDDLTRRVQRHESVLLPRHADAADHGRIDPGAGNQPGDDGAAGGQPPGRMLLAHARVVFQHPVGGVSLIQDLAPSRVQDHPFGALRARVDANV